ncbi:MAG: hypothetical protein L3J58_07025 [Emcibacter sp.]|nr:hypothetical protein [Emcibacter sp.]
MGRSLHHILFLLLIFFINPAAADETPWSEKKLGKAIIHADKAAGRKNWPRAIIYGEQALRASSVLDQQTDARYINLLKNLNRYYDKAGRLQEVAARVRTAYFLSREYLGQSHETTMINRMLYYKILIAQKAYEKAIPLVLENIAIVKKDDELKYKLHHYLAQLFSLYGLTEQLAEQENALLELLELNEKLFGRNDESSTKIRMILAKNYCRQKKISEFAKINKEYNLQYTCVINER